MRHRLRNRMFMQQTQQTQQTHLMRHRLTSPDVAELKPDVADATDAT